MENLTHYPLALFVVSFVALSAIAAAGAWLRRRTPEADTEHHEHVGIVLAATLTLLGLIIGFTFSMAINRYDQRKNFEEAEANAIGTEMLRADFLPAASAANVRKLLGDYTNLRIQFYLNKDDDQRKQLAEKTAKLQAELWAAVRASSSAQPTPVEALALAGMNDVINAQGFAQAAYWNRIPIAAWLLLAIMALCSNALMGYRARVPVLTFVSPRSRHFTNVRTKGTLANKNSSVAFDSDVPSKSAQQNWKERQSRHTRSAKSGRGLMLVLPLIVSFAFLLIADIDAPRHGLIEVRPQNLESLAKTMGG